MREQRAEYHFSRPRRASLTQAPIQQRRSTTASHHGGGHHAGLHPEDRSTTTGKQLRRHLAPAQGDVSYEQDDEEEEADQYSYATMRIPTSTRRYDMTPYPSVTVAKGGEPERQAALLPRQGKHPFFSLGICMLIVAVFITGYVLIPPALQHWNDDRVYGYPRTYQTDANVGHGDSRYPLSHFIVINLNGRIEVVELPQGDTDVLHPHLYLIARLAMQGSDLVPATVSFADMNGDGKQDMVVTFNGTQWILFNNGTTFVPRLS
jgi:hypothetical protein